MKNILGFWKKEEISYKKAYIRLWNSDISKKGLALKKHTVKKHEVKTLKIAFPETYLCLWSPLVTEQLSVVDYRSRP
jgi:hypothetical protein